jgi:hypothetical protein
VQKIHQPDHAASGSRARLIYAALVGAVAAALIGYLLSVASSAAGLALVIPAPNVEPDLAGLLTVAGLNYCAIQLILIVGEGPGAAVRTSWPLTTWAVLPALALIVGGAVSGRLSGIRGAGRFAAGASIAIPYTLILLAARGLFALQSESVRFGLPQIAGADIAPETIPALLSPAMASTILYALLFGLVFGGIGAIGLRAAWRGLVSRESSWPAWARGAVYSLVVGHVVLLLIFTVFLVSSAHRLPAEGDMDRAAVTRSWVTALPTMAGFGHYASHGVTLRGSTVIRPGLAEIPPDVRMYGAGLMRGIITEEGQRRPIPAVAYIALILPAAALTAGGFMAAKTGAGPVSKPMLAAGMAGVYALLMTAMVPVYTLAIRTQMSFEEFTTRAAVTLGPAAAQTFVLGLILAFVFALLGAGIYRSNGRSQSD